ncbi:helix-turn-helix domain-containing protein [Paenarthrobacter nitroguajacolicus]|uniref:helix-turn-helix domain-containing protein n=1 Tax=Paenarthrobacter nitroguajacolicus TaxID=211146 RepID=UPI004054767C
MENTSRDDTAGKPDESPHNQIRRYAVPVGLGPEEKFEHWRSWYSSAIDAPVRLEMTDKLVRPTFNPTALTLDGPGFSLVDVTNEPANCFWNGETRPSDWLVYFRTACNKFSFSGRGESVSPGTVRFFDLSSPGNFHAPAGFSAVRVHFDRDLLGLDDRAMKRLKGLADIRQNPILRGLILPALSGWQRTVIAQEIQHLQPVVRSMMLALVSSLLETPADPDDLKLARIATIKKFVRKNFRNPALTVDEVVAYSLLSRRALYYLFKDETLQVSGYIRALRTLEAVDLLAEANAWRRSLADIAGASGFTSLPAMRRAVKEVTGLSLRDAQEKPALLRIRADDLRQQTGL